MIAEISHEESQARFLARAAVLFLLYLIVIFGLPIILSGGFYWTWKYVTFSGILVGIALKFVLWLAMIPLLAAYTGLLRRFGVFALYYVLAQLASLAEVLGKTGNLSLSFIGSYFARLVIFPKFGYEAVIAVVVFLAVLVTLHFFPFRSQVIEAARLRRKTLDTLNFAIRALAMLIVPLLVLCGLVLLSVALFGLGSIATVVGAGAALHIFPHVALVAFIALAFAALYADQRYVRNVAGISVVLPFLAHLPSATAHAEGRIVLFGYIYIAILIGIWTFLWNRWIETR